MAQTRFKVEDGLLVNGQANVTGNVVIGGTLKLEANVISGITANGHFLPQSNVEFNIGSSNYRWLRIYANSMTLSANLEVTGLSSLYGGVYLEEDITFKQNNYSVGNTTAMPILYTSNTFVYNTLRVAGPTGDPYFLANSTTVVLGSNAVFEGDKLTIGDGKLTQEISRTAPFTISTNAGAPTTIHEFAKASNIRAVKYFVYAKNNTSNDVQCSNVTLMYYEDKDTAYISESDIMHSNTAPFVSFSAAITSTQVRLVAVSTVTSIDITVQKTMLI